MPLPGESSASFSVLSLSVSLPPSVPFSVLRFRSAWSASFLASATIARSGEAGLVRRAAGKKGSMLQVYLTPSRYSAGIIAVKSRNFPSFSCAKSLALMVFYVIVSWENYFGR